MSLFFWILFGFLIALSFGPITGGGSRRINEAQLAKFQQKVGLPLPQALRAPVLERIVSLERWTVGGGLVGLSLGAIGSLFLAGSERIAGLVILASVVFVAGLSGTGWVVRSLRGGATESPRVARGVATDLADYVPSGERFSARLAPVLALLSGGLGVGLLFFIPRDDWLGGWLVAVAVLIGIVVVVTITTALLSRRVLDLGQRAGSDLELAWDDVVRAQALRGLWMNVTALGVTSVATSFIMVGDTVIRPSARAGAENLTLIVGTVAFVLALVFLLVLLLPVLRDRIGAKGLQHVLRSLWPDASFTEVPLTAGEQAGRAH